VYLARALEPELYGLFAVVVSVVVWWELSLGALFRQATERAVAAADDEWRAVAGSAVRSALIISALSAATCYAVAPWMAKALGDARLADYIRLMSLDIPLWVLWATWTSVLNGRRLYGRRSISAIAYWSAKAILMCGLVALGLSVRGALIGSIGASAVGLLVAWGYAGFRLPSARFPRRELLAFGLPLMGVALVDHVMLSMDLWFVKAIVPDPGAAGLYGIGKYAFQAAALLPLAVCGAAFPTMTKAVETRNQTSLRELIQQASRFVVLLDALLIAIMASSGREIVRLIFGDAYVASWSAVAILIAGAALFGLRLVATNALAAGGRPGLILGALAPMVPLNIALNYLLVPAYGLVGGSVATVATLLVGAAAIWWLTWREFRVLPSGRMAIRIAIAGAAIYGVGFVLPGAGWYVLLEALGLVALYALLLVALGELRSRDLEPLLFWRTGPSRHARGCVD